jgi:hypothetical protein
VQVSQPQGTPIGESAMPAWARPYLSEGQRELGNRALQWVLMFDHTKYLDSSARDLCRRLHIATLGNDDKVVLASQATLARWTGWSEETVRIQLAKLDEDGWINFTPGAGTRRTRIKLTWPTVDPIAQLRDTPDKCMAKNKKTDEGVCKRNAGWGTTTPGIGPCKLHGGTPKNAAKKPPTAQRLGDSTAPPPWPMPQLLGDSPVDNHHHPVDDSGPTPQPLGFNPPTVGVGTPQPLGFNPPAVGGPYVREYVRVSVMNGEGAGRQSVRARVREAIRWLSSTYGLTDHEAAQVWAIAEARASEPIKNPIRYLSGRMTDNGSLADIVETVQRPMPPPATEADPPPPQLSSVPDWCGECFEDTRLGGDPDRPRRCPNCHPLIHLIPA